ncbi:MAG: LPS export ABC transporter periplasmic protein LptC [Odoribacter sp.]
MIISLQTYLKSITILMGVVMLLSCKNDIQKVNELLPAERRPEMTGQNLVMIYSDSAKIKYKMIASDYVKINKEKEKYEEFRKGIYVVSFDNNEKEMGSIRSKYAKKLEDSMLWEARDQVVIINAKGEKLETELLYWDMNKKIIYTDRYARLTANGQIIEGNDGFESDQNLEHPVFKNITGSVEVEKQEP